MKPTAHAAVALAMLTATSSDAQSLREVFRQVNPSVVLVEAKGPPRATPAGDRVVMEEGVGSGVLISADGRVLTAAHVVRGADEITVRFTAGEPVPARVVATAPFADIALLQLARVPAGAAIAIFGDSDLLDVGDQVFTIGAPYGANHSLAVGWISARRVPAGIYEDAIALEVFQTDLSVYQGNSGGPLFNLQGEVVGIVTHELAKEGSAAGPSFSVTGNVARRLMIDQRRTWFGVESLMIDAELARALHLPEPVGMLVHSVANGSLAHRLGIREGVLPAKIGDVDLILGGDVLLEVHGVPVSATPEFLAAFNSALGRLGPGDTVTARVWRGGKSVVLTTTVVEP